MEVKKVFRSRKMKKENKVTERALYASLFSMVLCCAMLLETTYAWFTQEITTGVAVIQTGEMSAALVVESGTDSSTGAATYATVNADNSVSLLQFKAYNAAAETKAKELAALESSANLTEVIMAKAAQMVDATTYFEPGGTYYLPPIYVENTGNIDLQYMVTIDFSLATTTSASDNYGITTAAETEGGAESSPVGDLRKVISFMVSNGENTAVDMESLVSIPTTIDEESTEGGNADSSALSVEETLAQVNAYQIYSGELSAPTEETRSISEPIIIKATMPAETEIDWADLKLSGIQIYVTATQLVAPVEELGIVNTETENTQ